MVIRKVRAYKVLKNLSTQLDFNLIVSVSLQSEQ